MHLVRVGHVQRNVLSARREKKTCAWCRVFWLDASKNMRATARAAIRFFAAVFFYRSNVLRAFPLYPGFDRLEEKNIRFSSIAPRRESRNPFQISQRVGPFSYEASLNKETISIATTCTGFTVCACAWNISEISGQIWETTGKENIKSGAARIRVAEWKRKCPDRHPL